MDPVKVKVLQVGKLTLYIQFSFSWHVLRGAKTALSHHDLKSVLTFMKREGDK